MALCNVFPPLPRDWSWSPPLRHFWRKAEKRGSLIPLDLALLYFRTPEVWIDTRQHPPVITDREPSWSA